MNQLLQISACAVTLLLSTSFMAQGQVKEDFVPSTKNHPGKEYPMVNSQGYARFKVDAPEAKSVTVTLGLGGSGGTKLEKQADGSWMGTTAGPMDEGFHYYHLIVDDGTFNDPGTLNYFGSCRWESGIEIPAHDRDFYALKDVPHGNVQQVLFNSPSTGTPNSLLFSEINLCKLTLIYVYVIFENNVVQQNFSTFSHFTP